MCRARGSVEFFATTCACTSVSPYRSKSGRSEAADSKFDAAFRSQSAQASRDSSAGTSDDGVWLSISVQCIAIGAGSDAASLQTTLHSAFAGASTARHTMEAMSLRTRRG